VGPLLRALCRESRGEHQTWDALRDMRLFSGGCTALMQAAAVGDVERVRWLRARGAALNLGDDLGVTPLMYAAGAGHEAAAAALLDFPALRRNPAADIDAEALRGCGTALAFAVRGGHGGMVRFLLARGATLQWRPDAGWPLCWRWAAFEAPPALVAVCGVGGA